MDFDWLQTAITLLPIAGLIWKAALMSAELKDLRNDLTRLEGQVLDEKNATDTSIASVMAGLQDIKIAIARLETKLESRS